MDLNDYSVVKNLVEGYYAVYGELDEANRGDEHVTSSMYMGGEPATTIAKQRRRLLRDLKNPDDWSQEENQRQERHTNRRRVPTRVTEQTDLFDYLLEYLISEGYADTNENAIAIMANMSEEWREEILESSNTGGGHTTHSLTNQPITAGKVLKPSDIPPEDRKKSARRKKRGSMPPVQIRQ